MNIESQHYKYIFVGGKGGVGKTTTSCSIATQIALRNPKQKILIISTDPAHNVSDAFAQQFSSEIQQVKDMDNLFAVEIDAQKAIHVEKTENELMNQIGSIMNGIALPGMDEILNFLEVMKLASVEQFDTIVFDTAPTGHTMRFLELPRTASKLFGLLDQVKGMLQPMIGLAGTMGMDVDAGQVDAAFAKLGEQLKLCTQIKEDFEDPTKTTFICVAIPEFLSLYETERLVQFLARTDIDCRNIVVNQVIDQGSNCKCKLCLARSKMQQKYLNQMRDLYAEDFTIVQQPMLEHEVRGLAELKAFGKMLFEGH